MKHVILEGCNGGGKTSIIKRLSDNGYKTLSSPNGTELAKYIRQACRGADQWKNLSDMVKFLLFSAARTDEFNVLVKDSNQSIICDRWHLSTWCYQVKLGNIPQELYEYTIPKEEKIDKVFIFTAPDLVLINRMEEERKRNPAHSKCSWTEQHETLKKINKIYTTELPIYLESKHIPYTIIDSEHLSLDDVYTIVKNYIDS